jgi:hypothetical protein
MRRVVLKYAKVAADPERAERLTALLADGLERLLRGKPGGAFAIPPNLSVTSDGPATGREEEAGRGA